MPSLPRPGGVGSARDACRRRTPSQTLTTFFHITSNKILHFDVKKHKQQTGPRDHVNTSLLSSIPSPPPLSLSLPCLLTSSRYRSRPAGPPRPVVSPPGPARGPPRREAVEPPGQPPGGGEGARARLPFPVRSGPGPPFSLFFLFFFFCCCCCCCSCCCCLVCCCTLPVMSPHLACFSLSGSPRASPRLNSLLSLLLPDFLTH